MKTPELESLFNKFAGLEVCDFIKKRLQLSCFPLNIAKLLRTPILKNICQRLHLRILKTTSCLFLYPLGTSKNESFRYFQQVYKETNVAEWVNTSLYKSKEKFVCVPVDQALISKEQDVKNLTLSDFMCRRVSISLIDFFKIKIAFSQGYLEAISFLKIVFYKCSQKNFRNDSSQSSVTRL